MKMDRGFSIPEAKLIISDLFEHRLGVYALDFALSAVGGWICFVWAARAPVFSWRHLAFLVPSVLLLFRAAILLHPIFHLPKRQGRVMKALYHAGFGIPFLIPYFIYAGGHRLHHQRLNYATDQDPEYERLVLRGRLAIILALLRLWLLPAFLVLRFGVLSPLAWMSPRARALVQAHASALPFNSAFRAKEGEGKPSSEQLIQEALCFAYLASGALLVSKGILPARALWEWYWVGNAIALLNLLQLMVLHRYEGTGSVMSMDEQILDSVNTPGAVPFLTALWAPVGQRFHALHHVFPTLPYHNLAQAHERLVEQLPPGSPYRKTLNRSFASAFARLWAAAGRAHGA